MYTHFFTPLIHKQFKKFSHMKRLISISILLTIILITTSAISPNQSQVASAAIPTASMISEIPTDLPEGYVGWYSTISVELHDFSDPYSPYYDPRYDRASSSYDPDAPPIWNQSLVDIAVATVYDWNIEGIYDWSSNTILVFQADEEAYMGNLDFFSFVESYIVKLYECHTGYAANVIFTPSLLIAYQPE